MDLFGISLVNKQETEYDKSQVTRINKVDAYKSKIISDSRPPELRYDGFDWKPPTIAEI